MIEPSKLYSHIHINRYHTYSYNKTQAPIIVILYKYLINYNEKKMI